MIRRILSKLFGKKNSGVKKSLDQLISGSAPATSSGKDLTNKK